MPPKELPGFYYDPEKNRYFPIKGPIPGASTRRRPRPASPTPPHADTAGCSRKRARRPELLSAREMYGGGAIFSNKAARYTFKQQCQYAQASQPMAWKYQSTTSMADKALELFDAMVQTPQGLKKSRMLMAGSTSGFVRLYGLGGPLENFGDTVELWPRPAWTPVGKHKSATLPSICSAEAAFSRFSSSISCIKKLGRRVPDASNTNLSVQPALVATLGSGESGGHVYIVDLPDTTELEMGSLSTHRLTSHSHTIWTADCTSDGTHATFGMDRGAMQIDLETRDVSWLCRSKSDIFSQKFVQSDYVLPKAPKVEQYAIDLGNVVLCGLRNGSIAPVDVRQNNRDLPTGVASSRRSVPMLPKTGDGKRGNQADKSKSSKSRIISMSSAICSLVTLSSDENYFLGSAMDGSIKLFDLRLIQKGGIQSYEGHVNSHSHLPLAVDPSETLLMSGGEDCTVRIWSIKTGKLIFAQSMADTPFTATCWPESSHYSCGSSLFDLTHSWGAWLGSHDGLFYMHGT